MESSYIGTKTLFFAALEYNPVSVTGCPNGSCVQNPKLSNWKSSLTLFRRSQEHHSGLVNKEAICLA
ncbi:unnamed protein product [Arctia plantaginis]|uniref:Uncharacterized protein n=1 Tax=Arctia plantaginis TaxID=874455 RepID=A0A8S1AUL6_ARCPL|nr:unnamed protein product [Arctia plantaginis]